MPRKTSRPTDPWAAMDALFKQDEEPTGPEWFTRLQFQSRYDVPQSTAEKRLASLVSGGQLENWRGYSKQYRKNLVKYRVKP